MLTRTRWRQIGADEVDEVRRRLVDWPAPSGGAVRHMFPLATIEARGASAVRVAATGGGWAACVGGSGNLVVPCGDPEVIEAAGMPNRRWRLVVGDAAAADALLGQWRPDPHTVVHPQRYQVVDPSAVPDELEVPDPGLRLAAPEDIAGLAQLAVRLHIDDRYGPDPGRSGLRAYRQRMERSVAAGAVLCVGGPGEPVVKIERSVHDPRWGTQLSGICVRRSARGRGLGTAAVATAIRWSLDAEPELPVALHVRADNRRALATYARAGFVDREEWRLAVRS